MKKFFTKAIKNWHLFIIIGLLSFEAIIFFGLGEKSYIASHDNLDLFIPHLRMLKESGTFFAHNASVPILGGITRDVFGSELSLYNLLYFIFPSYYAYMIGYFFSIATSMVSCYLLAKDILKENLYKYRPIVLLFGLLYGILPVFPAYCFSFTSIPFVLFLLRRLYSSPKPVYYIALFCYPFISYFSYFGFFILAYLVCFTLFVCIRDKKFYKGLLWSIPILFLGYAFFEYRLFYSMLFDKTETIRSTMLIASFSWPEIFGTCLDGFLNSTFHSGDSHKYLVLPIVILYLIGLNLFYLFKKKIHNIFTDPFNLLFLLLLFNCFIYGMYYYEPMRNLIITLLPPLEGFQYYRTIFFNPFLWYLLLFLIVKRLYDYQKISAMVFANAIAFCALFLAVTKPAVYNIFYDTCYNSVLKYIKHIEPNALNYQEFYSESLFDEIKEDLNYSGEYSIAYGFHPGILTYNGISTLDGYLGLYSQNYKEEFRKIIAPSLEKTTYYQSYFDNWGARAYVFPASDEDTYLPYRQYSMKDPNIYIDRNAFATLKGIYIFSRCALSNAPEENLCLVNQYSSADSPYSIYVYKFDNANTK